MNLTKKIVLATCGVLSVGALTACQSTPEPQDQPHRMMDGRHGERLSPEQRAEREQMQITDQMIQLLHFNISHIAGEVFLHGPMQYPQT